MYGYAASKDDLIDGLISKIDRMVEERWEKKEMSVSISGIFKDEIR